MEIEGSHPGKVGSSRLSVARKICFSLFSLAFFYVGLELGSRVLHPVPLPPPVEITSLPWPWIPTIERDHRLFFRMRPNSGADGRPVVNELGLRGPALPEKGPDEFRILSLGESTTFGWMVAYEKTYSQVLERRLGSVDGRSVRVLNAGVPASTSFQGLTFLRHPGLSLKPDAVLVYFGGNDFAPRTERTARTGSWLDDRDMTDPMLFELRRKPLVRLSVFLFERSNLFRALVTANRAEPDPEAPAPGARLSNEERVEVLRAFMEICSAHDIRLAIIVPWYREDGLHEDTLRRFAEDHAVDLIDLPMLLQDRESERARLFLDSVHPSRRGHYFMAVALERALRELWNEPAPWVGSVRSRDVSGRGESRAGGRGS